MTDLPNKPPLADQVFEDLGARILTGILAPGDLVPTEHELTEQFGVNRQVVREALQRLEQVGLVRVSRGARTRVLDFELHADLDLLGTIAKFTRRDSDTLRLWHDGLRMRAAIAADIARLCAAKGDPALAGELLTLTAHMRDAETDEELIAHHIEFWRVAVAGADNIAYRLAFNTLLRAAHVTPQSGEFTRQELSACNYLQPLAVAIASADVDAAEQAARTAMTPAIELVAELLDRARGVRQAAATAHSAD